MLIRQVSAMRGLRWVCEGFALFRAAPLIWVVDVIAFAAVFILLSAVPFFGSIAATLVQPVLVAGLLAGCRDIERGNELRIEHLFLGFREKTKPLLMVGLTLGLASIGMLLALIAAVFGTGLLGAALTDTADWTEGFSRLSDQGVLLGALFVTCLAMLLSLPLAMAAWFAPALVMFHEIEAWDALKASFVGCLRNMWPFLVYGVALFVLLVLALIPLGLGLLIWTPLFFGSLYASYNDVYRETP